MKRGQMEGSGKEDKEGERLKFYFFNSANL